MKKFTLLAFTLLCFGIMKAHEVKKAYPCFTQKTFTVIGMNVQKNYEVTFKFFPQKKFIYGPAPKAIMFQNKLMMENQNDLINTFNFRKSKKDPQTILSRRDYISLTLT